MKIYNYLKKNENNDLCIVIGVNNSTGLSIIRDLGTNNIRIIAMDKKSAVIGRSSIYCNYFVKYRDDDHLLDLLLKMGKQAGEKIPVLVSDDSLLAFMEKYQLQLSPYFLFQWQKHFKLIDLMQKYKMMQIANDAGLKTPKTYCSLNHSAEYMVNHIEFPSIIKPLYTKRQKTILVESRSDFRMAIKSPISENGFIVQEIIQGPESNLYLCGTYSDKSGHIFAYACGKKKRQLPKDYGIATLLITDNNEILRKLSEKLIKHIGYAGPSDIEFKKSSLNGEYIFIEINPRLGGVNQFYTSSGLNLPYWSFLDLKNRLNPEKIHIKQNTSVKFTSVYHDFLAVLKYYKEIRLYHWIKELTQHNSFALLSMKDPFPFAFNIIISILDVFRKLLPQKFKLTN